MHWLFIWTCITCSIPPRLMSNILVMVTLHVQPSSCPPKIGSYKYRTEFFHLNFCKCICVFYTPYNMLIASVNGPESISSFKSCVVSQEGQQTSLSHLIEKWEISIKCLIWNKSGCYMDCVLFIFFCSYAKHLSHGMVELQ